MPVSLPVKVGRPGMHERAAVVPPLSSPPLPDRSDAHCCSSEIEVNYGERN